MTVEGIGTIRNRVVPGSSCRRSSRPAPATVAEAGDPSMTGRVGGKVMVVTGAARGQGAAEVRLLAAEGARSSRSIWRGRPWRT